MHFIIVLFFLLLTNNIFSQNIIQETPQILQQPDLIIQNLSPLNYMEPVENTNTEFNSDWVRNMVVYPHKTIHLPADNNLVKQIKAEKRLAKLEWAQTAEPTFFAPTANDPIVFRTFDGNDARDGTPTDNTIAISNDGIIISAVNSNIRYYNTNGDVIFSKSFYDFLADTNLKGKLYDPVVTYDPQSDRFIFVLLHGNHSSNSKLIICFSKTKNPADGWNKYYFPITTISSNYTFKWIDFPKVGISNDDLFISGNIFKNNEEGFSESIIMQIEKQKGYQNKSLTYRVWKDLQDADKGKPFTLYPVSWGKNGTYGPHFYFISTKNAGNSDKIFLYEITGKLGSTPVPVMKTWVLSAPKYELSADVVQKRSLPNTDPGLLDVGDCRIQSAFYQISRGEGIIHYTHHTEYNQLQCAISYGRINLATLKITEKTLGKANTDYAYPAIASSSTEGDHSRDIIMAFLAASPTMYPGVYVVGCDDNMNFSSPKIIKEGDANVNILHGEDERWGDYTGIARKHNTSAPRIWLSGAYGSSVKSGFPPVTSYIYKNYIAEVSDNAVTDVEPEIQPVNVQIFPNPVHQLCHIRFSNETADIVKIVVYNNNGQHVITLFEDYIKKGDANFSFNINALASGVYFVKVFSAEKIIANEKIVVNK